MKHAELLQLVEAELARRGLRSPHEIVGRVENALQRSSREIQVAFVLNAALRILARRSTSENRALVAPLEGARDACESGQPIGVSVSDLRAMVAAFDGDWLHTNDLGCEATALAVRALRDADREALAGLACLLFDAASDDPVDHPPILDAPATLLSLADRHGRAEVQEEGAKLEAIIRLLECGAPVGEIAAGLRAWGVWEG
ncbi:Hypothetical protein A7982_01787 [Minicystis rosea]|nr:Hypothetical protein A7982_01787 [Minicystis rosea]